MYMTDNIFLVLLIKHLVNHYGEPTIPHKIPTGAKLLVSNLHILFCPCVVQKLTSHVDTRSLNMHHQSQKGFWGIFVRFPQHEKGTLYTYLLHGKYFLHVTLYLMEKNLVCYHTRYFHG